MLQKFLKFSAKGYLLKKTKELFIPLFTAIFFAFVINKFFNSLKFNMILVPFVFLLVYMFLSILISLDKTQKTYLKNLINKAGLK